ncbi:MAG TPA: hypothetical protein DEB09_05080 [Candidatus Magasanikbacteria bacterium]|nr:hypothetical protein [Candidatus Magasanikbacteria bacterium]
MDKWHGGSKYEIGYEPSGFVAGSGQEFLLHHLTSSERNPVLDWGAWRGRNLSVLRSLGREVVAVDGPWARQATIGLENFVEVQRFSQLPFPDDYFSAVLSWRVLHNMHSVQEIMASVRELRRVMCLGAPLLLAVRVAEGDEPFPVKILNGNGNGGKREDFYFSENSLRDYVLWGSFKIVETHRIEEGEMVDGMAVMNRYIVAECLAI